MSIVLSCLVFSCMALAFFPAKAVSSSHEHSRGVIGVILDSTSRAGREAKVSIKMALDDIGNSTNQSFVSHIINSQGKPLLAALAARNLIGRKKVQAILGPHTWKETSLVAEVANKRSVPTLSLAGSTPKWETETWPFLVQASVSSQDAQMKAVAAIVQSYDWHRVTLIYEEGIDSDSDRVIPNLFEALREARADISHLVPLQAFLSPSISEELKRLKEDQCKVFVVHTSLKLATHLFENAKAMQMMEKGYVWITTNTITDLVHSLDVSAIFSMQGTLGIKTHFSTTGSGFVNFKTRFREKFSLEYPEEENNEPGIYAVEAYDAMSVVALALDQGNMQIHGQAQHFIEKIPSIDFNGMTGRVFFTKRNLVPSRIFGVVNVIEKKSRELGFWSEGLGFSKSISEKAIYNYSMQNLGEVIWPGEPRYTPRGWTVPTSINNSLRIGVPANAMFKQFVNTPYNPLTRNYSCIGYAIKIFNETMARLPYVPYHFVPFNGTYDSLAEQIYLNEFDAVVHVGVTASRCKFADFTHTYTDSALTMIVPVQSKMPHKAWLFMKPFTKVMWALICAITIYNGFVIWLIERHHNSRLRGSAVDQTGIMISSSFTTLFSLHGGRLHSNLSRLAMMVWIFVALVITQSYTACLSSMLTVRKLEPTVADTETLKNNNATVGYWTGGFAATYLEEVLGFKACNIQNFSSPLEFAQALKTGQITAGFINGAYVELFLAKYCKSLIVAGPSYKIGGFGFAFPRGSPMLADVNEALLNVLESKKLRELEDSMIGSEKCVDMDSTGDEEVSLSLDSFWILFVFTGSTTTCALLIYYQCKLRIVCNFMVQTSRNILSVMLKNWEYQPRRISNNVYNAESLGSPPVESNTHSGV